jgi:hypothetical protein
MLAPACTLPSICWPSQALVSEAAVSLSVVTPVFRLASVVAASLPVSFCCAALSVMVMLPALMPLTVALLALPLSLSNPALPEGLPALPALSI